MQNISDGLVNGVETNSYRLYVYVFGGDIESVSEESVFMTASVRDVTTRLLCGDTLCNADRGEVPDKCPEDCGCGNGIVNPRREQCDDGNKMLGDGCDAMCNKE